jgi:hypothetical protein
VNVTRSERRELATAFHEAGHAVVAYRLRYAPRSATIIAEADYAGQVAHPNVLRGINLEIDGSDQARLRAERLIKICLAGPAAQRHHRPTSFRRWQAQSDYDLAADLALHVTGGGESATMFLRWLEVVTKDLVTGSWPQIEAVAAALMQHKRLTGTQVKAAIEATMPGRVAPLA